MALFSSLTLILVLTIVGCGALFAIAPLRNRAFYSRFSVIRNTLPQLNCGVCGFATCMDYARAVTLNQAVPSRCFPGGPKVAHTLADIMGIVIENPEPVMAVVHCRGDRSKAAERAIYTGIDDCLAAVLIGNGTKTCFEGCLGFGTCVRACPFDALTITPEKIAVVNPEKCNGCGACISKCPRNLLSLIPVVHKIFLGCNNHQKGTAVSSYCTAGCTGCGLCEQATHSGAISIDTNLPVLNYFIPTENFVTAAYSCPSKCFIDLVKARPKANIDTKCDGCTACISACPVANAITGEKGKRHVIQKDKCIGCGLCLNSCHAHAISLWGMLGFKDSFKPSKHTLSNS